MGILGRLFGGTSEKKEEKVLPWQQLTAVHQLDEIEKKSTDKLQVLFKHSTRCGISRSVINRFVNDYDLSLDVDLYYLDLLNFREVSNEVAHKFQVIHQSPQLLLIKNGSVVHHASHHEIFAAALNELV